MSFQATVLPHEPVAAPLAALPVAASGTRPRGLLGAIRAVLARLVDADKRYRDARHMHALPDHILRDIGMTRGDLRLESRRVTR